MDGMLAAAHELRREGGSVPARRRKRSARPPSSPPHQGSGTCTAMHQIGWPALAVSSASRASACVPRRPIMHDAAGSATADSKQASKVRRVCTSAAERPTSLSADSEACCTLWSLATTTEGAPRRAFTAVSGDPKIWPAVGPEAIRRQGGP
eukprot:scaffold20418_cov112-Isochrysis_galbana.AAC.2